MSEPAAAPKTPIPDAPDPQAAVLARLDRLEAAVRALVEALATPVKKSK